MLAVCLRHIFWILPPRGISQVKHVATFKLFPVLDCVVIAVHDGKRRLVRLAQADKLDTDAVEKHQISVDEGEQIR